MSRSIHSTIRAPQNPNDRTKKRRIKALAHAERARNRLPSIATTATIPITVRDRGPRVRYPATERDIREVIARLPNGVLDGLGAIELLLDEGDRNEIALIPGVRSGAVLGRYKPSDPMIRVYGFVVDEGLVLPPHVELWLRLRMLATFVHEVGHHEDHAIRIGRGRWRDGDVCEVYAEAIEYAWVREYVIPYLEEAYPTAVDELAAFTLEHGGIALSLEALAGDPRTTASQAPGAPLFFTVESGFEYLLADVARGKPRHETRTELAKYLSYGDRFDEAHAILDRVLADHAGNPEARALRADILVEQGEIARADAIVRDVVAAHPENVHAWEVAIDIARKASDWSRISHAACSALRVVGIHGGWRARRLRVHRIRARIELGDLERAGSELTALEDESKDKASERQLRELRYLRGMFLVRSGSFAG